VLTTTEEEQVNNNKKENPGKETESEKPPRETSQANAYSYYKRHMKRLHTIHKQQKITYTEYMLNGIFVSRS
jgi:hypothetical protein